MKSMDTAQQTMNYRINVLEVKQREVSTQHSAIEVELRVNQSEGMRIVRIGD
jgi:hypothetical protein